MQYGLANTFNNFWMKIILSPIIFPISTLLVNFLHIWVFEKPILLAIAVEAILYRENFFWINKLWIHFRVMLIVAIEKMILNFQLEFSTGLTKIIPFEYDVQYRRS